MGAAPPFPRRGQDGPPAPPLLPFLRPPRAVRLRSAHAEPQRPPSTWLTEHWGPFPSAADVWARSGNGLLPLAVKEGSLPFTCRRCESSNPPDSFQISARDQHYVPL
jgi:hypothetical protein